MRKRLLSLLFIPFFYSCGFYTIADGAGCFVKGTKILTPQGSVAIETLAPGREVLSWDESSDRVVVGIVDQLLMREDTTPGTLTLVNGNTFGVTADHPVYSATEQKWLPVEALKASDQIKFYNESTKSMELANVAKFERNLPAQTTYNLKVRHYENSFAEGMLAHFY